jgi:CRISPR-associated protein Cas1
LQRIGKESKQLLALVPQIKSGDPDNIEGRAASVYWKILFQEHDFTRTRFGIEPNSQLNYCYAILRAIVARALVSSGMLPTLGIFHRNKYNAYCLADDIMEPYRPFCDELVYKMFVAGEIEDEDITREQKVRMLSIATCDVLIDGNKSPLMVAMSRTTNSLYECFEGTRRKIVYPMFYTPDKNR